MTENFSDKRSQQSGFSKLAKHRQAIVTIEYTLDTEMPIIFTVEALVEFGTTINAAIDAIRHSNNELIQEECVLDSLRVARDHTQLAIDKFSTVGDNEKRYKHIRLVRKELEAALTAWQIH